MSPKAKTLDPRRYEEVWEVNASTGYKAAKRTVPILNLYFPCGCEFHWEKIGEALWFPENHQSYGWVPETLCDIHEQVAYGKPLLKEEQLA